VPFEKPGHRFGDRYRNTPQARIVEMLVLLGHAYETDRDKARVAALEALERWIGLGLPTRHEGRVRLFDPVEVLNFFKAAGVEGRDDFWAEHFVATHRRCVEDLAALGKEVSFQLDFRRRFHLAGPADRLRLRMPLPLLETHGDSLSVEPIMETAGEIRIELAPGRLEARVTAARPGDLTIGAALAFSARRREGASGGQLDDKARELYLRPREGLIVVSERVRSLASSLAAGADEAVAVLRAFWDYVMDELTSGAIHYDQVSTDAPCDWVLDTGWFDCQLASALFVALCRARAIPARQIGGQLLYRRLPTNHYWAEAWIEDQGWLPVDFLSWDLSRGGRDKAWRDKFFGRLDPRMVTQIMPLSFTGALGVPLPADFILLQTQSGDSVEISLGAADGTPVYTDRLQLTR
jgi:Transglutaminase-like superfamily